MSTVRTKDLLENFNLTLIAGNDGIHRQITTSDLSRPGMEMTGYFKFYPKERLQLIGRTEMAFYLSLTDEEKLDRAMHMCTDVTPGIVVSRGMDITKELIQAADESGVPLMH